MQWVAREVVVALFAAVNLDHQLPLSLFFPECSVNETPYCVGREENAVYCRKDQHFCGIQRPNNDSDKSEKHKDHGRTSVSVFPPWADGIATIIRAATAIREIEISFLVILLYSILSYATYF